MTPKDKPSRIFPLLVAAWCSLLFSNTAYSQIDSTRLEFYPLHLGDLWQWKVGYYDPQQFSTLQVAKADTVLPNGYHYAAIGVPPDFSTGFDFLRIDSLLRVQNYVGSWAGDTCGGQYGEFNIYRLGESAGSVWRICQDVSGVLAPPVIRYNGMTQAPIFGEWRDVMWFQDGGISESGDTFYVFNRYLVRGIGRYREEKEGDVGTIQLQGAIINGIQYGTIVSVERDQELPKEFFLGQNFPNPFNPATQIEYILPSRSKVVLKVFNILGQEVRTLIENVQDAGNYTVTLDGRGLASGVYLYRIHAISAGRQFVQTRKLLLLR
jgi:hypothetical protein